MHVFVAGATGVLGRAVTARLLAAGHQVTGTTRTGSSSLRSWGATPVQLDVFDAEAVKRAVASAAPDAIIHELTALRGGTSADNPRIRRIGTRNLVDAALLAAVPRMVAQSVAWAYAPGDSPASEHVPLDFSAPSPRATTVGGVTALESATSEVSSHVVLRYGLLYGPGTWYHREGLISEVLRAGASHPAAPVLGAVAADDAVSSFIHLEDAAAATVSALEWPSGAVNIVDDEPAAARHWLPAIAAAVGAPVPPGGSGRQGWQRGASNSLARSLGWRPQHPSWRTGFFLG